MFHLKPEAMFIEFEWDGSRFLPPHQSTTTMEVITTPAEELEEMRPTLVSVIALSQLSAASSSSSPSRLTIWRKSLLFNGNGYTVYDDSNGNLVFRVDNYACDSREGTFLMDFAGNVLFTIRRCRKKLGILESWEAFRGDKDVVGCGGHQKPFIRATKSLGNPSCKISVAAGDDYQMIWSRKNGWSKIYNTLIAGAIPVAEVNRKCGTTPESLLGKDVLSMIVQPGTDQAMMMAMVMINDAMR